MNAKKFIPAALLVIASASASFSTFAGTLGNELTEQPQPASTLTREQVRADTLAALKRGELRHSAYDEQESVVIAREHRFASAPPSNTTRAEVRAETRAFFKSHPNSQYELETYGIGG